MRLIRVRLATLERSRQNLSVAAAASIVASIAGGGGGPITKPKYLPTFGEIQLIPGGVDSACHHSEVGKMSTSLLASCLGGATRPWLCPRDKETALAAPTLCTEYGPNGWMDWEMGPKIIFGMIFKKSCGLVVTTWWMSWLGDENKPIGFWFRSGSKSSLSVGYRT